jgi:cystathionine beta-lyase/cystathionine gamma-synthase
MTPDFGPTFPLAPAIYPSSVFCIPDLDAVDAIYNGSATGFIYARDGHPNAAMLSDELRAAHHAAWGLVTATGMGAITGPLLALLSSGDRVVAGTGIYGRTAKLLRDEFPRFGVTTTWVDTNDLDTVKAALASPTKLVVAETISNPLCRVADIPALAEIAHGHGAKLFIDNTFATPVLCKPLDLGADFVMESLTKMIGGHSDVILGFVCGKDAVGKAKVESSVSTWGMAANAFECWLTTRGLATLDLRMHAATAHAAKLAVWLAVQPAVKRVVYPGRPDHPDFALAKRVLPHGAGNMLCFELADRDAVNRWMWATPGVPFCPSLGHHATTCSHPDTTSHRFDPPAEKIRKGITSGLVRLSVGCEPLDHLLATMAAGMREIA